MTIAELIERLEAVPSKHRDMPVVLTLWTESFHAYGEEEMEVDADGAFLSISARSVVNAT